MTTTTDTAGTWRDLADRLTGEQVAQLEHVEDSEYPPLDAEGLVRIARLHVEHNEVQTRFAHIPAPADATDDELSHWVSADGGVFARCYGISSTAVPCVGSHSGSSAFVEVIGRQYSDGRIERNIWVDGDGLDHMNAAQARQVAAALLSAAHRLDTIDGKHWRAQPFA